METLRKNHDFFYLMAAGSDRILQIPGRQCASVLSRSGSRPLGETMPGISGLNAPIVPSMGCRVVPQGKGCL